MMGVDLDQIPLTRPGERLGAWRRAQNMSKRALATKIGVSHGLLARIEAGEVEPEPGVAERIGRVTDGGAIFGIEIETPARVGSPQEQAHPVPPGGEGVSLVGGPTANLPPDAPSPVLEARANSQPELSEARANSQPPRGVPAPEARGPGRPGFGLGRHGDGTMGLVLIHRNGVTALSKADADGMRADLDQLQALLANPLLYGVPQ
jgi:transcriptional regulator with XRE-family HTH domain